MNLISKLPFNLRAALPILAIISAMAHSTQAEGAQGSAEGAQGSAEGAQRSAEGAPQATVTSIKIKDALPNNNWITFYNLMHREFSGTLSASDSYTMSPEDLQVTSHSFGLGYNFNPEYSALVSGKYIRNDITLRTNKELLVIPGMPTTVEATTQGMSDTLVGLQRNFRLDRETMLMVTAAVSVPTGGYEEKTPSGKLVSYPGQLGSGTYDFAPMAVYKWRGRKLDFSTRLHGKIRTGRNDLGYRLGDEVMAIVSSSFWVARWFALTGSLYYRNWREVVGSENVTNFNNKVSQANAKKMRKRMMARHRVRGGRPQTHSGRPGHATSQTHGEHGHGGRPQTTRQRPSGSQGGGRPPSGVRNFASLSDLKTSDPFAASGSRLSAQLGVKLGMSLGPIFRGVIEGGVPVYHQERGELDGLETQWYVMSSISSQF